MIDRQQKKYDFESSLSILLVDVSNQIYQHILSRYLHLLANDFVIVNTYQKALCKLQKMHFDLIILDLNLSTGCGIDTLHNIRVLSNHNNIIAMTNKNSRELEQAARAQRVIYYLIKPFDNAELVTIVTHFSNQYLKNNNIFFSKKYNLVNQKNVDSFWEI